MERTVYVTPLRLLQMIDNCEQPDEVKYKGMQYLWYPVQGDYRIPGSTVSADRRGLLIRDIAEDCTMQGFTDPGNRCIKIHYPTLDKEEKAYLRGIIWPFRNKVRYIVKYQCRLDKVGGKGYRINIATSNCKEWNNITLPVFPANSSMYAGMEVGKIYHLEDLGL